MDDSDTDGERDCIGPQPPQGTSKCIQPENEEEEEEEEDAYLPALPPHLRRPNTGGNTPSPLPPPPPKPQEGLEAEYSDKDSDNQSEDEDDDGMYGPALPPHMLKKRPGNMDLASVPPRRALVGPVLPKGFVLPSEDSPKEASEEDGGEEEEEEDGEIVGPVLPKEKVDEGEYRIRELEQRAKRMKDRLEGRERSDDKPLVRESWMIELPEDRPNFCGLGPRQFLRKTPAEKGDRTCWTDTPADRARKQRKPEEKESPVPEVVAISKRDEELTEKVDEYNKAKRAKPLIDMHKKERKEKESAAGPKERRPFSREEDMNVNRFDDAQKTTILKKARQLNDRFSSGKAKFL